MATHQVSINHPQPTDSKPQPQKGNTTHDQRRPQRTPTKAPLPNRHHQPPNLLPPHSHPQKHPHKLETNPNQSILTNHKRTRNTPPNSSIGIRPATRSNHGSPPDLPFALSGRGRARGRIQFTTTRPGGPLNGPASQLLVRSYPLTHSHYYYAR